MDGSGTIHSPGAVEVAGGRIAWVGPADAAQAADVAVRRLPGTLMPGFVNVHCHTPMTLVRGAGEGLPVGRWLTEVMWPREGRLTPEDVRWGMLLGGAELLGGGVTTSVEMYFFAAEVGRAAEELGLRSVVTPPVIVADDLSRFGSWEDQLQVIDDLAQRWATHPLLSVGVGPHSAYALPEEPLRQAGELARRLGLLTHIHLAEMAGEDEPVRRRGAVSAPRYLEELGFLEGRLLAAHGVWLTLEDIDLMASRSVGVAHCPSSNAKHASGIAPVAALRAAGIPVGLGTDGPASHDRLDPFEEMRMAIRLARLASGDATVLQPAEALAMATREAAAAIGRDDLGVLEPGRRADLVLVETQRMAPLLSANDLMAMLVWQGSPNLVDRVWVEGREVVSGGSVATVDIEEARREVTGRARRLAG